MQDPSHGPLTETITIGADDFGLVAHAQNGAHKVVVARCRPGEQPALYRDGAALRECLRARDVLDLLAAGECGEFAVTVHPAPSARHDIDFEEIRSHAKTVQYGLDPRVLRRAA